MLRMSGALVARIANRGQPPHVKKRLKTERFHRETSRLTAIGSAAEFVWTVAMLEGGACREPAEHDRPSRNAMTYEVRRSERIVQRTRTSCECFQAGRGVA